MPLTVSRRRFLAEWFCLTTGAFVVAGIWLFAFLEEFLTLILGKDSAGLNDVVVGGILLFWWGLCMGVAQGVYVWKRFDRRCGLRWMLVTAPVFAGVGLSTMYAWFISFLSVYLQLLTAPRPLLEPGRLEMWMIILSMTMTFGFFTGLFVGLVQRWALKGRITGGWWLWVGATLAGWCVAPVIITVLDAVFEDVTGIPKLLGGKVVYGLCFGLIFGVPVGVATGLALWRMLSRTHTLPQKV